MGNYAFREEADMELILGEVRGNGADAVTLYAEMYPQWRLPKPRSFHTIAGRNRETGTVRHSTLCHERQRNA
jgi:hypothetical protein